MSGNDKISIQVDNAKRGEIVDRNGSGLAINKVFDEVGVVPANLVLAQKTANIKAFSDKFGVSVDEINQKLSQGWVQADSFVPITVASEPVTELPTGRDKRYRVTLLSAGEAAQLIGYTGTITAEDIEKIQS